MSDLPDRLPPRLREIVDDFREMDRAEKLDLLLEYAEKLPPLPERFRGAPLERVHECMTPVEIAIERQNGGLRFHFDIPPEAPTIRGFAEILREGADGATPEEVLAIPADFYMAMGLHAVISPQRLSGLHFMVAHMKRLATQTLAA
jgi:cysteine desulfuration protein SufE